VRRALEDDDLPSTCTPEKEEEMPRHWRPVAPDNPGPKQRAENIRKIVEDDHNGKLDFCGREEGGRLWWALVDVSNVRDPQRMWDRVGALAPGKVILPPDEIS
jgi:hypothetical protein